MTVGLSDIGQQDNYREWAQQKLRLVRVDPRGEGMQNEEIILRILVELTGAMTDEIVGLRKEVEKLKNG